MGADRTIHVAAGQLQARPLERADDALDAIRALIRSAGRFGVDLLVLPECAYPAYHLRSRSAYDAAPILGYEGVIQLLSAEARSARLHLVVGLVEKKGVRNLLPERPGGCFAQKVPDTFYMYNTAVLIEPAGHVVGAYRKQFLWDYDHDTFTPGESIDVFETGVGRVGMLICADARAPEIVATLAADRADIVAMPTNWVNAANSPDAFYNPQPDYLIPARCREFGLPFICANKAGAEDDETRFCGMSRIVAADGTTLAEAGPSDESVVVAELTVTPARVRAIPHACRDRLLTDLPADRPPVVETRVLLTAARSADDLPGPPQAGTRLVMIDRPEGSPGLPDDDAQPSFVSRPNSPALRVVNGVTVGCVVGADVDGFAWPRAFALQAAQVICLFGGRSDPDLLRARAAENRVFVAALTDDRALLIAPDATVLGDEARTVTAEVDLADAAHKTVAPGTDVFAERRPNAYRL